MSKCNLNDLQKFEEMNRKIWHKQLLAQYGDEAIRIIKQNIPEGLNLKEYLEKLTNEIEAEKKGD